MKRPRIRHEAGERLARSLAEEGPGTASELSGRLGVTPAGIRRTLQGLLAEGLVAASERAPYGPAPTQRRGRPSLVYRLTEDGRAAVNPAHDQLAHEALRFVARREGQDGVREFALQWARQQVAPAMQGEATTAQHVADALTKAGYAATVEPVGTGDLQICMHHCPIVDVATEFPVMCDAETEAISQALGRHVTRLATLAHGDGVCTTIVPQRPMEATPQRKVHA